jgi:hypothetical protein
MGMALWALCGVAVFAVVRAIGAGRPDGLLAELLGAIVVAFAAGLAATALDFGGWNEIDWRAGLFVTACSLAVIGIGRTLRLRRAPTK